MPRMPRATPGGVVYHVLNRANAGLKMFRSKGEYAAFEQALAEAHARVPVRVLAYCLMPDHWHLVVWPRRAGELSEFMRWLTVTHTRRWHADRDVSGTGHLYQGRYRSFPVEPGEPLLTVCRYVESNARRGGEVKKAQDWAWSSLACRLRGAANGKAPAGKGGGPRSTADLIDDGPKKLPRDWAALVNTPLGEDDLKALRNSVQRGTPFGSAKWRAETVARLGLEHTLRPRGRPRKTPPPAGQKAPPRRASDQAAKTTRRAATAPPRRPTSSLPAARVRAR